MGYHWLQLGIFNIRSRSLTAIPSCYSVSFSPIIVFLVIVRYKLTEYINIRLRLIEPPRDRPFWAQISSWSYYPAGLFSKNQGWSQGGMVGGIPIVNFELSTPS